MTDPFETSRFRVIVDGFPIASVAKVSALKRTTDVIEHREGVDATSSHKEPGLTRYAAITLTRAVTIDHSFEDWANEVYKLNGQPALAQFRKEMSIQLLDDAGTPVLTYLVHKCWVSEYVALPDLDADTNALVFESITVENEGWERQG